MEDLRVIEKLGSGNQASVYLVENIKTKERIALKTLVLKQNEEFNSMNQTLKEFSILKQLNHPNICQYINVYVNYNEDNDFSTINITMPYCSLGKEISHNLFSPKVIWKLI
jgi:serine/threonine protein kinase